MNNVRTQLSILDFILACLPPDSCTIADEVGPAAELIIVQILLSIVEQIPSLQHLCFWNVFFFLLLDCHKKLNFLRGILFGFL